MTGAAELAVYRASVIWIVLGYVASACFFVVGLTSVAIGLSQHDGVSAVAGAFGLLLSLWIGAVLATNRLIVTAAGLVRCSNLRRRFISWAEIQSFGVALDRRGSPVVIRRNDGSVVGTNIGGIFTRSYQVRVADELADWQRQLAPAVLGER
jgi:hypothetical protein